MTFVTGYLKVILNNSFFFMSCFSSFCSDSGAPQSCYNWSVSCSLPPHPSQAKPFQPVERKNSSNIRQCFSFLRQEYGAQKSLRKGRSHQCSGMTPVYHHRLWLTKLIKKSTDRCTVTGVIFGATSLTTGEGWTLYLKTRHISHYVTDL